MRIHQRILAHNHPHLVCNLKEINHLSNHTAVVHIPAIVDTCIHATGLNVVEEMIMALVHSFRSLLARNLDDLDMLDLKKSYLDID